MIVFSFEPLPDPLCRHHLQPLFQWRNDLALDDPFAVPPDHVVCRFDVGCFVQWIHGDGCGLGVFCADYGFRDAVTQPLGDDSTAPLRGDQSLLSLVNLV